MGKKKNNKAQDGAFAGRKKQPKRRRRGSQICYKCRQTGHFIGQCPQLENLIYKVTGENVSEVEDILDYRRDPLTHEHSYYVKWAGNDTMSWEVASNLTGAIASVVDYEKSIAERKRRLLEESIKERVELP